MLLPAFPSDGVSVPGSYGVDQFTTLIDGADGGDANGKFTWHPRQNLTEPATELTGDDAGGDYQKEDSEYMVQVVEDDFYFLSGDLTPSAAFSINGPYYRDDETVVSDSFSRSVAGSFGEAGGGYAWSLFTSGPTNIVISADGSRGKFASRERCPETRATEGRG